MDEFNVLKWDKQILGFTIFSLILIFGVTFYQLKLGEMKTRDMQRRTDAELLSRALRKYKEDVGVYPLVATGSGKIYACGAYGEGACDWNKGPMVGPDNTVYLNKLPGDPFEARGRYYVYETNLSRDRFKVYVALENTKDKVFKPGLTIECGMRVQCNWYVEE